MKTNDDENIMVLIIGIVILAAIHILLIPLTAACAFFKNGQLSEGISMIFMGVFTCCVCISIGLFIRLKLNDEETK